MQSRKLSVHNSDYTSSGAANSKEAMYVDVTRRSPLSSINTRTLTRSHSPQQNGSIRFEAESLTLAGYRIKSMLSASRKKLVSLSKGQPTGQISEIFSGNAGSYQVKVGYVDNPKGIAQATVTVGTQSARLNFNRTKGSTMVRKTVFTEIALNPGDRFTIDATTNRNDTAQIDWIEFKPLAVPISPPVSPVSNDFSGDWKTRWQVKSKGSWGSQNIEITSDVANKKDSVLRVIYPAGSASPTVTRSSNAPVGGTQFYATMGVIPQDAMHLSYDVRFSNNFDFVQGGKLPGLYGGVGNTGGKIPTGTDGFSTRFMWRQQGHGEVYAYLPTSEDHGTSLGRGNWKFTPGVWHHLEQEVKLNQPGQNNGQVQVWLDGRSVFQQNGLTFRSVDTLKLDGILFSTFFGGNDTTWSTPKDVYVDFANFSISPVT